MFAGATDTVARRSRSVGVRLGVFSALLLFVTCAAFSQQPDVALPSPATADSATPDRPDRIALRQGVQALMATLNAPGNEDRLLFPIIHRTKIIEKKVTEGEYVEKRYSKKIVTRPVYKNHYANVESLEPVKDRYGKTTGMKKVIRKKLVKREKIGEEKVERIVEDPNGDIVKRHHKKKIELIRGPGGPDGHTIGWAGRNAMVLYALLEAGVTPEQEPALENIADTIVKSIHFFGISDRTYDIAWVTAALARYPGDKYDHTVKLLTGRLISGQCDSRRSPGLWGPICVSTEHLAAVLVEFERIEAAAQRVDVKGKTLDDADLTVPQRQFLEARERVAQAFTRVSRNGQRFSQSTRGWEISSDPHLAGVSGLTVPGWPYNLYRSSMSDLQSTAVALFALRVAHEHDALDEVHKFETLRDARNKPLARPINIKPVLMKTLMTLGRLQGQGGAWNEAVTWEPTTRFARGDDAMFGEAVAIPEPFESRSTPICVAHAASALEDVIAILGEQAAERFGNSATAARAKVGEGIDETFSHYKASNRFRELGDELAAHRAFDPIAGGEIEPYAMFVAMRLDPDKLEPGSPGLDAYSQMIDFLVNRQDLSGTWPAFDELSWVTTPAVREHTRQRVKLHIEANLARIPKPKKNLTESKTLQTLSPGIVAFGDTDPEMRLATVHAVLALAQANGPLDNYEPAPIQEDAPDDALSDPDAEPEDSAEPLR